MANLKIGDPVSDAIDRLNRNHFVVNETGKVVIYHERYDPVMRRRVFDRMGFEDFRNFYCNWLVEMGVTKGGHAIMRAAPTLWLKSEQRRQYAGVTFDPAERHKPDVFNLWQGFAVKSRQGSWDLLREHVRLVICGGSEVLFAYTLDWLADVVQHPERQGEVAFVMRGPEGCGKGTLAKAMLRIFGQHGLPISNELHLTGNFNGHLRDCVFLFADEAFFAGDKRHVSVLKSIITEPYLTVEAKYQNAVVAANFLHLMMASNEEWVVPAGLESRRFFVLDVARTHIRDLAYFAAIYAELEAGGYEAMLHELLNRPLADANLRAVPTTEALLDQRTRSLDTVHRWWLDCLHRGHVYESRLGLEDTFGEWMAFTATKLLHASYERFCRSHHDRRPLSQETLGRWFKHTLGAEQSRHRGTPMGERMVDAEQSRTVQGVSVTHHGRVAEVIEGNACGYEVGALETARATFCAVTGLDPDWPTD